MENSTELSSLEQQCHPQNHGQQIIEDEWNSNESIYANVSGLALDNMPLPAPPLTLSFHSLAAEEIMAQPSCFETLEYRRVFMRNLFLTLTLQNVVTCIFILMFSICPDIRRLVVSRVSTVLLLALCTWFVLCSLLVMSQDALKHFPNNVMGLLVFSVFHGFLMGSISIIPGMSFLLLSHLTHTIILSLIALGFTQRLFNFSEMYSYAVLLTTVFNSTWICLLINDKRGSVTLEFVIYAAVATIILSLHAIFHAQRTVTRNQHLIKHKDYIFATLNVYLDSSNFQSFIKLCAKYHV